VQLIKNGKKIAAFVPMDGCLNFIEENVSAIKGWELPGGPVTDSSVQHLLTYMLAAAQEGKRQ
jgi:ribosomal protein S12